MKAKIILVWLLAIIAMGSIGCAAPRAITQRNVEYKRTPAGEVTYTDTSYEEREGDRMVSGLSPHPQFRVGTGTLDGPAYVQSVEPVRRVRPVLYTEYGHPRSVYGPGPNISMSAGASFSTYPGYYPSYYSPGYMQSYDHANTWNNYFGGYRHHQPRHSPPPVGRDDPYFDMNRGPNYYRR